MADKDTFNEFINELIDKNDILDVVREYVDLTRKGNSYWGRCPFHHEKTASFHVEERMKIYKCFGCGAAGNVIKFIQEIESVSFMEAVKILADRVGMKVPEFSRKKSGEDYEEKRKQQERHHEIVTKTARYYNMELMRSPEILAYLEEHGITRKIVTEYGLGYSANYYGVANHLIGLGYRDKEIEDAGVCYTTDEDKFQDVMAGRIVYPIINTFGKVAGFAGSTRQGDTIYTKNTDIFHRESELFGTHRLKAVKVAEGIDNVILTSTPMNAVALYAKGNKAVVSVMSDSIDARQARALMRYASKFTVVFGDVKNGIDKDYRGLDALTAEGGSVKVASLVNPLSVFELIEKGTYHRLEESIKSAKSLIEYQLRHIATRYDLRSKDGKSAYVREARGYIMAIKERSKQEPYISVLAKIAGVREDSIRQVFYNDVSKNATTTKRVTKRKGKVYNAMMTLLGYVSKGYTLPQDIDAYLEGEYLDYYNDLRAGTLKEISTYFNDAEIALLEGVDATAKNTKKIVTDCIKVLAEEDKKKKRDAIIAKISEETDYNRKVALLAELNALMRE